MVPISLPLYGLKLKKGDISFEEGDLIEIIVGVEGGDEWWVGKCNGKEGSFPSNYVAIV